MVARGPSNLVLAPICAVFLVAARDRSGADASSGSSTNASGGSLLPGAQDRARITLNETSMFFDSARNTLVVFKFPTVSPFP